MFIALKISIEVVAARHTALEALLDRQAALLYRIAQRR